MAVTLLHTADWQIGRPFRAFGDRLGGVLEDARLAAIERIAGGARVASARHVLVAGDVFDSETLPKSVILPCLERMARAAELIWHLLPGNHDPARPGGLWHRIQAYGLPANVRPHLRPAATEIEPGLHLLPAPLLSKSPGQDPTSWMDAASTPEGSLRIGLAHGSVYDFEAGSIGGSTGGAIEPGRARKAGLAYLALGDWHGTKRIVQNTWYAGTPEPDRYGDPASGQALIVRLDGNREPVVEPIRTGHFVWAEHHAAIEPDTELGLVASRLLALAPSPDRLMLKLSLTGSLPADKHAMTVAWAHDLGARLRHLALDTAGLSLQAEATDIASLFGDPRLADVAQRLALRAAEGPEDQRRTARRALARLVEIAREAPETRS